jgi:hypothetical protein
MILVGAATTTRLLSLLFILFEIWCQFSLQKDDLLGSYDGCAFNKSFKAI